MNNYRINNLCYGLCFGYCGDVVCGWRTDGGDGGDTGDDDEGGVGDDGGVGSDCGAGCFVGSCGDAVIIITKYGERHRGAICDVELAVR